MPPTLRRLLRQSLQLSARQGFLGALNAVLRGKPPLNPYPYQVPQSTHPFDTAYGVDTSGFHHGEDLALHGSDGFHGAAKLKTSALWNTAYYGIAPSVFDAAMTLTGVTDWSHFTFLDVGCGKGRALLLASRFPFLAILGVELDPALAAIAQRNISSFHEDWQQCHALEARAMDATELAFPGTPLLLYLYHPFLAPVLRRVLRRLERSVKQNPREIWLIYINPEAAFALKSFPFLREVARASLPVASEDALPDRFASSQEEVTIYHHAPQRDRPQRSSK